jgi:hypothetical protein
VNNRHKNGTGDAWMEKNYKNNCNFYNKLNWPIVKELCKVLCKKLTSLKIECKFNFEKSDHKCLELYANVDS